MHDQTRISDPLNELLAKGVEGADFLIELALDMRWSWNHATDDVWERLDPHLWNITRNPWAVLRTVSADSLEKVLQDAVFRTKIRELVDQSRRAKQDPGWFQKNLSFANSLSASSD
jgi:glycogen phosphorylase